MDNDLNKCCECNRDEYDDDDSVSVCVKFKLPQHKYEFIQFLSADELCAALRDVDNLCRSMLKYGEKTHTLESFCEMIRSRIFEIISRVDA